MNIEQIIKEFQRFPPTTEVSIGNPWASPPTIRGIVNVCVQTVHGAVRDAATLDQGTRIQRMILSG